MKQWSDRNPSIFSGFFVPRKIGEDNTLKGMMPFFLVLLRSSKIYKLVVEVSELRRRLSFFCILHFFLWWRLSISFFCHFFVLLHWIFTMKFWQKGGVIFLTLLYFWFFGFLMADYYFSENTVWANTVIFYDLNL